MRSSALSASTTTVGVSPPTTPETTTAMPGREELPDTLRRSPAKAQRTWIKAHDAAVEQYGEGERAHRTAFAALKRTYEKVGERWVPKDEPGPSDARATKTSSTSAGSTIHDSSSSSASSWPSPQPA